MTSQTPTQAAPKAAKPRKNRSPREKAQDGVLAAQGRLSRAETAYTKAGEALKAAKAAELAAENEKRAATAALEYAQANPDLKQSASHVSGHTATPEVTS